MIYDQNDCQQFSFITPLFPTLANTLKTKVGDVVGCIFQVECSVGGFLILKQIIRVICSSLFNEFMCKLGFFLARMGQFKTRVPQKAQVTHVFLFDEPLKGSKSLKIFKISLTFRFDKL
jgi:hypothetical protein